MLRLSLFVLASMVVLAGCREPSTEAVRASLVAPAELSLTAYVGGVARGTLELRNDGRASASGVTELGPPFAVQPSQFELAGGETLLLDVTLTGTTEGLFTQPLRILAEGEVLEVFVRGTVLQPLACDEESVCATSVFDPDDGLCELRSAPNGTACEAACLTEGRCQNGACAGLPVSCDDGDACTVDACEVASGCVHSPLLCPAPEDPCLAAVCDPATGCKTVPAPDGTSCGPAECDAARVCISGACVTQTLPEGAACGESSPCQLRGTCVDQVCVRPPATPLPIEWEHTSIHPAMQFHGHMDAQGNLYWLESPNGDLCELVSSTSAGVPRFRVSVPMWCRGYAPWGLSLGPDEVVISTDENRIESRSTLDGSFRWARSLEMELVGFPDRTCPDGSVNERVALARGIARASDGSLRVLVGAYSRCSNGNHNPDAVWLIAFTASGSRIWSRQVSGYPGGWNLKLDADDGAYFGAMDDLLAFDRNGTRRWTVATGRRDLIAVEGESLFLGAGEKPLQELRRSDGALVREYPLPRSIGIGWPGVANPRGGFLLVEENLELRLAHFERASGATTRTNPLFPPVGFSPHSDMHLTQEGRALMGLAATGIKVPELFEVTPEGEVSFRCALDVPDGETRGLSGSGLGQERWFFWDLQNSPPSLRAYRLPGRTPATKGWVNGGGTPSRSFSPR